MKMLLVIYSEALDEDVITALEAIGVECFTRWTNVHGRGKKAGPRMDTAVWPGGNSVSMFVLPDDMARKAMDVIRGIRAKAGAEGVSAKAFLLNVEDKT
jgi:nitrogen regulatory protein PII